MPTDFLPFDELTYPEVAALPRDSRIVLPVTCGFDHAALAPLLGNPAQVWLLPSIPFGWPGSGLDVPRPVFSAVVRNLISNLLEDGFNNVWAVVSSDTALEADIPQIVLPDRQKVEPIPADSERGKVDRQSGGPCFPWPALGHE